MKEKFKNLVSDETEMAFRQLLGENALLIEDANNTPERNLARFLTVSTILEQRKLRESGRTDYVPQTIKTPDDLLDSLSFVRFSTTDSDLAPGNLRTDENPLNVPLAYVCEIATSEGYGGLDPNLIAETSNILIEEVESRVHPKPKKGLFGLIQKIMPRGDIVGQEAQLAEGRMLNNIIQAVIKKTSLE